MPNESSIEDRLETAQKKLEHLLDRHRRLEEELRWVDGRQNELKKLCDDVERAITDIQDPRFDS